MSSILFYVHDLVGLKDRGMYQPLSGRHATLSGEERCVTTLIRAAKETRECIGSMLFRIILG